MFDGRISLDGIATVKNFVVGSYFPTGLKSSEKAAKNFAPVSRWRTGTYDVHSFSTGFRKPVKAARLRLLISA
jgi:hypothetical protein